MRKNTEIWISESRNFVEVFSLFYTSDNTVSNIIDTFTAANTSISIFINFNVDTNKTNVATALYGKCNRNNTECLTTICYSSVQSSIYFLLEFTLEFLWTSFSLYESTLSVGPASGSSAYDIIMTDERFSLLYDS